VASRDKVSSHTARAEVDVGRALESLPAIRAAAEAGDLSLDQLVPLVSLASPETDAEWATRARHTAPTELNRMVRKQAVVTPEEMEARRRARQFRWWRSADGKALRLSGEIFDVDAAFVEAIFEHEIETMRPAKGQAWELRSRRGADALVAICRQAKHATASTQKRSPWRPTVVVHVGSDAQPTVNGMPLAVDTVTRLIDDGAKVRDVHADDPLAPTRGDRIPPQLRDYLTGRDTTCRMPGCGRTFGLDAHHIVPRCQGGPTDKHNIVLVCTTHHHRLVPHGRWSLDGDPETLDGLVLRELTDIEARAGPAA
jgi:hypothetical protein